MKADPEAQHKLLELQAIDTALAQLAHRRRTLPQHAELERLATERQSTADDRARAQVEVDDLDRDIARLERDVEQVRQRADRDQARLDAGAGSPKELESFQHELASLARRQGELEDSELELMEQRESAQAVLTAVEAKIAEVDQRFADAEQQRDTALAEIAADEERRQDERKPLVSALPADLLALYERIRESSGIGAAILRARRCEGCHLDLSGSALSEVRAAAPDEVVRCEECRRILVRTAESGL